VKKDRGVGDPPESEKFSKRERQEEDIRITPPELRCHFALKKFGVAAGDDNMKSPSIVERAEHPAPIWEILDFIKEEKGRISSCELIKSDKERFHVLRPEPLQSVIFEVNKEDILFRPPMRLEQRPHELIHEKRLTRSSWSHDGKDVPESLKVDGSDASWDQFWKRYFFDPLCNDLKQRIDGHGVYLRKQFITKLFPLSIVGLWDVHEIIT